MEHLIRTPGELTKAIRVIRANLADGTLASAAPFEAMEPEGPWPDVLQYEFRCPACDARFSLIAETYHGRGGSWTVARAD